MTDEMIIKALECCSASELEQCKKCPLIIQKDELFSCLYQKQRLSLDLINRQKEEIERLNVELKAMRGAANSYKMAYEKEAPYEIQVEVSDKIEKQIKMEAIKDFAKYMIDKSTNGIIQVSDIPDYVKEMTEE